MWKHILKIYILFFKEAYHGSIWKSTRNYVEELGKEPSEVTLESTFEDLEADSLDLFQVISEIEDAFDIQIETEEGLSTVGDLVAYVEEKQNNDRWEYRKIFSLV